MNPQFTFRLSPVKFSLRALALWAGLVQFACSPTYLLRDEFTSETIGQLPTKNIPGTPAGDAISYIPQIEPRLRIVKYEPNNQSSTDKALSISSKPVAGGVTVSGHTTWLTFTGVTTGNLSKTINYLLFGKFDNFMDPILIDLNNQLGSPFIRLEMEENGMLYALQDYTSPGTRIPVCQLKANVYYTISFQINLKDGPKGTCRLSFIGDLVANGENTGSFNKTVPLMVNPLENVTGPIQPAINFNWPDAKAAGRSQFILSSLTIKQD